MIAFSYIKRCYSTALFDSPSIMSVNVLVHKPENKKLNNSLMYRLERGTFYYYNRLRLNCGVFFLRFQISHLLPVSDLSLDHELHGQKFRTSEPASYLRSYH